MNFTRNFLLLRSLESILIVMALGLLFMVIFVFLDY